MKSFSHLPSSLLAAGLMAVGSVEANSFGNYLDLGTPNSGTYIREANSTIILPDTPNPMANDLALWTGMGMSNGDLIQAIIDSAPGNDVNEWCVFASVLLKGNDYQSVGPGATGKTGDQVQWSYQLDESSGEWNQYVYLNGNLVSTYTSSKGAYANGWGTAEECQPGTPCGYVPQHQWTNNVITLQNAQSNYGSTQGGSGSSGSFGSSDGGYTWVADTITIDAFTFS